MDLARPVALAVDAADLRGEDEPDIGPARPGNIVGPEFLPEREEPGFRRLDLFVQLLEPSGMSEVSGADNADALELRPLPDAFRAHVLARCAGVAGVDVEVGDEMHGGL